MCTATNPNYTASKTSPKDEHLKEDVVECKGCATMCNVFSGECHKCGLDLFAEMEGGRLYEKPVPAAETIKLSTLPAKSAPFVFTSTKFDNPKL